MSQANIDILNQLLALEYRSLAQFIKVTSPWVGRDNERAYRTLENIVADQNAYAQRVAELIVARGGIPDSGEFPIEFTDLHMLSLDFLIGELIRMQRYDIELIEDCVARLQGDREARNLAEEILGSERAHLEALEELATPVKS